MLYFSIIVIVVLTILAKSIYKDVLCPAVLVGVPWLLSMILLVYSNFDFDINSPYFLYFTLGIFVFQLGYMLTNFGAKRNDKRPDTNKEILINNKLIRLIILSEFIILIIYITFVIKYIRSAYIFNILYTLKIGIRNERIIGNGFIRYFTSFITAFTAYIIFAYLKSKNFRNKENLVKIQLIIGSLFEILSMERTTILLYCILILTEFFIYSNFNNKDLLKYGSIFGVIGLIFFSMFNLIKYPYLLQVKSPVELALEKLSIYASGSLVTFQKWVVNNNELLYGENTFRFFQAVLKSVGYDLNVQNLIKPYIYIAEDTISNVYTIYYYYANDFGLIYALGIQFLIGIIHGFLYKNMTFKKPLWVYLFSLSLYPLIMQFFHDQYFSLTSTWVQYIFYGLFFFKSRFFINYKEDIPKIGTKNINLV